MRNARLAAWILSLVTTPERASATVGDLLEDRLHAAALRFWGAVLFAALSQLWRDVVAHPKRMAVLAVYGVFLELLLSFVVAAAVLVVLSAIALVASGVNPGTQLTVTVGPIMPLGIVTAGTIVGWALGLVAQFQVGRVLAKRSPGRELAPCVATTLLAVTIPLLLVMLSGGRATLPTGQLIRDAVYGPSPMLAVLSLFPPLLVLLAGAARVRRQRLSASR
ncbi:MAG TPA: hypothetical protein VH436_24790 [Vicinamibacterales bacterium]|jgi:hypothetical protein